MKRKIRVRREVIRQLGATDIQRVAGGTQQEVIAETEPYSFCGLCEPYTWYTR
jgi:hypothetical protein